VHPSKREMHLLKLSKRGSRAGNPRWAPLAFQPALVEETEIISSQLACGKLSFPKKLLSHSSLQRPGF
jgi:hypothetical protein